MTIENVITRLHEAVTRVTSCENANVNAFKDYGLQRNSSFKVEAQEADAPSLAGTRKKPRDEVLKPIPRKYLGINGCASLRVRRNVKWAAKLEEHWDGLERKQPCLLKPKCGGLKSILKKESGCCLSPVSLCLNPSSSDTSYTSDEEHQLSKRPRLKFKLRYGCGNADAESSIRQPLVTL